MSAMLDPCDQPEQQRRCLVTVRQCLRRATETNAFSQEIIKTFYFLGEKEISANLVMSLVEEIGRAHV